MKTPREIITAIAATHGNIFEIAQPLLELRDECVELVQANPPATAEFTGIEMRLLDHLDQAQSERRKFVKAMQLAIDLSDPPSPAYQERFGKTLGYNNGWRVAEAMREVLVDCLGLEEKLA